MKVSLDWIKQWVDASGSDSDLADQLTMAGLEIDDLSLAAPEFSGVVVAEVLSTSAHPDADKLKVVQVTDGSSELQIVCGASNVRPGLKVPLATVGAKLPGDFKIKKGKLRGVESFGMLCGASELGLVDQIDGLMELEASAPVGTCLREYLNLDDSVLDVSITPNRGDCFSVLGLARELAVAQRLTLASLKVEPQSLPAGVGVCLNTEACTQYAALSVTINPEVSTPLYMQQRLMRSGVTPSFFAVDLTNYIMLETGQPMHAFDADTLEGDLEVRLAVSGETLTLLNSEEVSLTGDELVIADQKGAVALAGVMGGSRTQVSASTTKVVFESAHFTPLSIAGRARRFGLHTDASQRFERGVDPALALTAPWYAAALLAKHEAGSCTHFTSCGEFQHAPAPIELNTTQIKNKLGFSPELPRVAQILSLLGFEVSQQADKIQAVAPSHRFDVTAAEDLIEEVARIEGYENLPVVLPSFAPLTSIKPATAAERFSDTLKAQGFYEAVTFSFTKPAFESALGEADALSLANPISQDLSVMRTTLLSSLVASVQHNLNRQMNQLKFFETGLVFHGSSAKGLKQTARIGAVVTGSLQNKSMHAADLANYDFYDLKHDAYSLILQNFSESQVKLQRSKLAFLHPGQSADIFVNDQKVGWMGALTPQVTQALDLPQVFAFELDLQWFEASTLIKAQNVSKFPGVRRDFALVVDQDLLAAQLLDTVRRVAGATLKDTWIFDVYEGDELRSQGKKSIAIGLEWLDESQTMDDEQTQEATQRIVAALKECHGAELRGA